MIPFFSNASSGDIVVDVPRPTPQELIQSYNDAFKRLSDNFFDYIPDYIEHIFDYASNEPLCLIMTSCVFVCIAVHFVRNLLTGLSK